MNKGQKKLHSGIEAVINTVVGYVIAVTSQEVIFPMYGVHIPLWASMTMALWFTVVSVVRSYSLRRLFNRWQVKGVPFARNIKSIQAFVKSIVLGKAPA